MEDNKFFKEWKEVTLGDIYEIKQGKHLSLNELLDEGYVVYGANGKVGYYNNYMYEKPTLLVTCRGATCGSINLTGPKSWVTGNSMALIPREEVNINFMKYLLTYISFKDVISGSAQPQIIATTLKKKKLTIPPLNIQKKISGILEKAERVLEKRKEAIKLLDELVKSRFIEMFGGLSQNNKGWEEVELSNVCSVIHRYPTFYGMDYIKEGTPVIRIGNILSDGILEDNMENYIFVYDDVNKDFPLTTIELGDILMAVRGDGSAAKRIGLVTKEKLIGANISPNLLRIKAKKNVINNVYLFWYLISDVGQKRLDAYVNKTAKKNIAAKDIKKVITPIPPLDLQNEFATFVNHLDKLKFEMQNSLAEMENNFNSLMQRAFKGELFKE